MLQLNFIIQEFFLFKRKKKKKDFTVLLSMDSLHNMGDQVTGLTQTNYQKQRQKTQTSKTNEKILEAQAGTAAGGKRN